MTTLQYVSIDSRDSIDNQKSSEMTVNLSHPIQNAKTVSVISFSTPNELYNIKEDANSFQIQVWSTSTVQPVIYKFEIIPGLYTMQRLVDACNESIVAKLTAGVSLTFTLLASYKDQFTTASTSQHTKNFSLYHVTKPEFTNPFYTD